MEGQEQERPPAPAVALDPVAAAAAEYAAAVNAEAEAFEAYAQACGRTRDAAERLAAAKG